MIIVGSDRLQQWLLRAGLAISAVLLIRFAIDFTKQMSWWLAAPFWLLVIAALGIGGANILGAGTPEQTANSRSRERALLLSAIPLSFLASSLDCSGLSLQGCSAFCTFIKLVWIPLMAAACLVYYFIRKPGWLTVILVMSLVALVPHCLCYNLGNAWWIDHIGASPLCYGWGFVVSVIAVGALRTARNDWPSLAVCFAIIAGSTAFFVSHHYFHYPW